MANESYQIQMIVHSANWCGPCKHYVPKFVSTINEVYPDMPLTVIKYSSRSGKVEEGEVDIRTAPRYMRGFPSVETKVVGAPRGVINHPEEFLFGKSSGAQRTKDAVELAAKAAIKLFDELMQAQLDAAINEQDDEEVA